MRACASATTTASVISSSTSGVATPAVAAPLCCACSSSLFVCIPPDPPPSVTQCSSGFRFRPAVHAQRLDHVAAPVRTRAQQKALCHLIATRDQQRPLLRLHIVGEHHPFEDLI